MDFWSYNNKLGRGCLLVAFVLFIVSILSELILLADNKTVAEQLALLANSKGLTVQNTWLKFYITKLAYMWYAIFILAIAGFLLPFKRSFQSAESLSVQFGVATSFTIAFLVVSLIYLSRQAAPNSGGYTIVIGVFTVISASIGWLISTQLARKHEQQTAERANHHHRRTHSLNIILQLNTSRDFHEKLESIDSVYPVGTLIPEEDVKAHFTNKFKADTYSQEKYEAITAIGIMLDTYEFIFEGISQGDLDGEVIYQSIGGGMLRNIKRASPLINAIRNGKYTNQPLPKVFCRLVEYYNNWSKRHAEDEEQHEALAETIKVRPTTPTQAA